MLRAPTALYRADAGWLLGHRFLMLTHRGRRSGRDYQTVLEVLNWDDEREEAIVMSGFGQTAEWYRNVLAGGAVEVRIARRRFTPEVRPLGADEGAAVLAGYERRNRVFAPIVRRVLSRLSGERHDGTAAARRRVVEALPLLALRRAA